MGLSKCAKFATPQAKVNKIIQLNGCIKCGSLQHVAGSCKFRFKNRCVFCRFWHFSFLCSANSGSKVGDKVANKKVDQKDKSKNMDKPKEVTSSSNITVVTEAQPSIFESQSILPTFTCNIQGTQIRALKDLGCQNNFVKESTAENLNLSILNKEIKLCVKGFNSSKDYATKIVEVVLEVDGQRQSKCYMYS